MQAAVIKLRNEEAKKKVLEIKEKRVQEKQATNSEEQMKYYRNREGFLKV